MKHYIQPETQVLQIINNSIICASGGPIPAGQLGTMKNGVIQMGTMSYTEASSF